MDTQDQNSNPATDGGAKEQQLAAIDAQEALLLATIRQTPHSADAALRMLTEAQRSMSELRAAVERNEAAGKLRGVVAALHKAGVSASLLTEAMPNIPLDVTPTAEQGAAEQGEEAIEDRIIGVVPTSEVGTDGAAGAKTGKPISRATSEDQIKNGKAKDGISGSEDRAATALGPETLLNGRFTRNAQGEYRRQGEEKVSFHDQGNAISFIDKQMDTFQACIELAAMKGWSSIEVAGSPAFRSEAWLHARMAGLEVVGYEPTEKDKLRYEAERAAQTGKPMVSAYEASTRAANAMASSKGERQELNVQNGRYKGEVVHQTEHHVVQETGRGKTVVHEKRVLGKTALDQLNSGATHLSVAYNNAVTRCEVTRSPQKQKDKGMSR